MEIEELRAYVKSQQDKAWDSYGCSTYMMNWREAALYHSPDEGAIDLARKILNMIDYGQETRPVEPKEIEVKAPKEPLTEEELKKIRERNERIKRAFKSFYDRDITRAIVYDED